MTRSRPRSPAPVLLAGVVAAALLLAPASAASAVPERQIASPMDAAAPAAVGPADSGERWAWPVSPVRVTSPYRAPATRYGPGHRGVDLEAAPGAPVVAPTGGVVRFAGTVVDRPVVTLDAGDGVLVSIEPVAAPPPVGTVAVRGQPLGTVGAGGHCDAACIHLGVRVDGEYVSPLAFFGGVPRAVLLPLG